MELKFEGPRERVRQVWIAHQSKSLDRGTISIFTCNEFKEIDVNNYWFPERDRRRETVQSHSTLYNNNEQKDASQIKGHPVKEDRSTSMPGT